MVRAWVFSQTFIGNCPLLEVEVEVDVEVEVEVEVRLELPFLASGSSLQVPRYARNDITNWRG